MNLAAIAAAVGGRGGAGTSAGSNPPVVTTVAVSPSTFTVSTGNTRQLTASSTDQFGHNISDTYTWTTSNAGVATVSSTGLVTGVSGGAATITVHSVSVPAKTAPSTATVSSTVFNPTTGAFIGGSNGAVPLKFDAAVKYASDSTTLPKWRDVFAYKDTSVGNFPEWIYSDQSKNGTIPYPWTGALYTADRNCDLALWQNTTKSFNGDPMFQITMAGENAGESAPIAILRGPLDTAPRSLWIWHRRKMSGWTAVGDATSSIGIAFNNGTTPFSSPQSKAYKYGPAAAYGNQYAGNAIEGRAALEMSGGSGHSGGYESTFIATYSGVNQGISGTNGLIDPVWDVGAPEYDHLVYFHGYDQSGATKVAFRVWRKLSTDPTTSFVELGTEEIATIASMYPAPLFGSVTGLTGINMNQSFSTTQSYYVWGWAAWDPLQDANSADPFGVL